VTQHPVLIAGGGIAGLAAALAAASAGREAHVFERAATFEEVGAGLQLGPNAVKALTRIGAWKDVSAIATTPPAIVMRDAMSGRPVRRIRLSGVFEEMFGAPYRVAHRADLHSALLAATRRHSGIEVSGGRSVSGWKRVVPPSTSPCKMATA
jgi:salicylate hydroxylase